MRPAIEAITVAKPAVWWLRALHRRRIACGIAFEFESFRHHEQIVSNAMIGLSRHPDWGDTCVGGLPWHFSATPGAVTAAATPGADTDEIRARFGAPQRRTAS